MGLLEVDEAASLIREKVDENANIIFGTSVNEELDGIIKVSIVATGIDGTKFNLVKQNEKVATNELDDKPKENNSSTFNKNENYSNKSMDVDNSEQIDIETKIADLDSNDDEIYNKNPINEKTDPSKDLTSLDALEDKKKELSELINNNKIDNEEINVKENTFFKKNIWLISKPKKG